MNAGCGLLTAAVSFCGRGRSFDFSFFHFPFTFPIATTMVTVTSVGGVCWIPTAAADRRGLKARLQDANSTAASDIQRIGKTVAGASCSKYDSIR